MRWVCYQRSYTFWFVITFQVEQYFSWMTFSCLKSAPEDLVQCSAPQRGGTAVISSNYSFVQYSTCNIGVRLCNLISYKTGSSKIGILTLIQVQPIFLPSLFPSLHKRSHPVKKNTAYGQHSALLSVSISWLLAIP